MRCPRRAPTSSTPTAEDATLAVRLRLFAQAREAAGTASDDFTGAATVGDLTGLAIARYGDRFAEVLATSRVWVNGDEPLDGPVTPLVDGDEVAVLPPVSGG